MKAAEKGKYYENQGNYYRTKHRKKEKIKPQTGEPVLAQSLSRKFGISEDILAGAVMVRMEGKHKVCIENYRHMIEYSKECVRIQVKYGRIHILGSELVIAYYRDEEMCIVGNIKAVEYI